MLALIDGDILLHEITNKIRTEVLDNNSEIIYAEADFARGMDLAQRYIDDVLNESDSDMYNIILSDMDREANFRKRVYPRYKSNRGIRPLGFSRMRSYVEDSFPAQWIPTLEADDIQGIMATNQNAKGLDCLIVSIDKDMQTIPGHHFNPTKPELGVTEVTPVEADYNFFYQALTGDSTDGYPGCPGVGAVGAKKVLSAVPPTDDIHAFRSRCWEAVVAAYKKAKLTEEDALVQARCARILRADDYDFDTKAPKLWSPEAL